MINTKLVPQ